MKRPQRTTADQFRVGLGMHLLSGMVSRFPSIWQRLGQLESLILSEELKEVRIQRPVYITGLARSGTTILLEVLASHSQVVTHQYRDFPGLFTPYWWGHANRRTRSSPTERAHGDRLLVSAQSPEAMEEMLWMAFFPHVHDSASSHVLDHNTNCPRFEAFYRRHIRKLLLLREGARYVAKGNYLLTRLAYLKRLFPDASFIIPIRHPLTHIASLMRQHRRFTEGQRRHPRAISHLERVGHFEFGLARRAINPGATKTVAQIEALWKSGAEIRGWARYWALLYGWLDQFLRDQAGLRSSVQVVRYEDLCDNPRAILERLLQGCELRDPGVCAFWSKHIAAPEYYRVTFSNHERGIIEEETSQVCSAFGYSPSQFSDVF